MSKIWSIVSSFLWHRKHLFDNGLPLLWSWSWVKNLSLCCFLNDWTSLSPFCGKPLFGWFQLYGLREDLEKEWKEGVTEGTSMVVCIFFWWICGGSSFIWSHEGHEYCWKFGTIYQDSIWILVETASLRQIMNLKKVKGCLVCKWKSSALEVASSEHKMLLVT